VATRYDKLPSNFLGFVQLATIRLWVRFVRTAGSSRLENAQPWMSGLARLGGSVRCSKSVAIEREPDSSGVLGRQGAYDASMRTTTLAYGHDFICRHCGAQYLVSYTELPIADSGSVYCDVCRRRMIQWNSSQQPSYKLVKRPDPK